MKINNLGLEAFHQVALSLNMTEAASKLGLTQSALSQRVAALEDQLETTLFIREGKGLRLTEAGQGLLIYSQNHKSLEEELLTTLQGNGKELAGFIRIASYSSILRSKIIPTLAPFLRSHPKINVEFSSHEISELEAILRSNKADLVISNYRMNKKGITQVTLGEEEYVLIESEKHMSRPHVYLDHDPEDSSTVDFFAKNSPTQVNYQRSYMGDIYGILDGVELGLGRAVVSKHLLKGRKVKIVAGYKKYTKPIVLHYYERPYFSRLFKEILNQVTRNQASERAKRIPKITELLALVLNPII